MKQPLSHDELARYLEGEVTVSRAQEIEAALAQPENAARLERAKALRQQLANVEVPSVDVAAMVQARLKSASPPVLSARRAWTRRAVVGLGSVLAAACVLIFFLPGNGMREKGNAASADRWVGLHVYRTGSSGQPEPVVNAVRPDDELWFAYTNLTTSYGYLMVFSVDDSRHVAWYYPDHSAAHQSVAIRVKASRAELPDRVRHTHAGTSLSVVALFSAVPLDTADVERRVQDGRPLDGLEIPNVGSQVIALKLGEAP